MKAQSQPARIEVSSAIFFECDVQDKFGNLMQNYQAVSHNSARLAQIADIFKVPLVSTYQVKFGPTDQSVKDKHSQDAELVQHFEKSSFSMCGDENVHAFYSKFADRKHAVLYGLEAHVCIRMTALDLISQGYTVHLVVDSCSSMSHGDRNIAIEALRDAGVRMTSFQSLVFELLQDAKHPKFKDCLALLKMNPKEQLDLHYYTKQ